MTEYVDTLSEFVEEHAEAIGAFRRNWKTSHDMEWSLIDMRGEVNKHRECDMCNSIVGDSGGNLCKHCQAWRDDTEAWIRTKSVMVRIDGKEPTMMHVKSLKELFPKAAKVHTARTTKAPTTRKQPRAMPREPVLSSLYSWKPIASTGAPLCLTA